MADTRKEVTLRMTVEADASRGSQAMRALADDARRAGDEASRAGKAMRDAERGGAEVGGGGGSGGVLGAAAKVAGVAAAAGGLVQTALNLSKAWSDLDDQLMTTRDKVLGFAGAIPVVGTAIRGLISSLMEATDRWMDPDREDRVSEMRANLPMEMAQAQAREELRKKRGGLEREVAGAGFRADAIRDTPTTGVQMTLGRAAFGQLGPVGAFFTAATEAMDPRIEAGLERIQAAKREEEIARRVAAESSADVEGARPGARRAMRDFDAAAKEERDRLDKAKGIGESHREMGFRETRDAGRAAFGSTWAGEAGANLFGAAAWLAPTLATKKTDSSTPTGLEEARMMTLKRHEEASRATADLEEKILRDKQAQLSLIQKQHEVAKAETQFMRDRVQMLNEEYAKAKAGASQFGAMDYVEQDDLFNAFKRFQAGGRENVTAQELGQLQGNILTREAVGRRAEEDAKSSPIYQAILQMTGQRDAEDIKRERDKLKAEVDLKVQFDEEKFARQMEASLKKLNLKDLLGEVVKAQFEMKMRDAELGMGRRAAGGG